MADKFLSIKLKSSGKLLNLKGEFLTLNKNFEKRLSDKEFAKKDVVAIAEMIKEKIESNIDKGKNYMGSSLPNLRPSTIESKGHSKPLVDTGKLRNSVIVDKRGGGVTVRMSNAKYKGGQTVAQVAAWLQEGTGKHMIRPKKKGGMLAWKGGGGKTHFSKGHMVSGIRSMRFFGISQKDLNSFVKKVFSLSGAGGSFRKVAFKKRGK